MKSIICSFLLLTTFCLVPYMAFSSTFTSEYYNPIVLPTTTNDLILPTVLDRDGQPLKIGEEYYIIAALPGGRGVYSGIAGGTRCPNAVAFHILSGEDVKLTPVKFFTEYTPLPEGVVREMDDINIMFSGPTPKPCVNKTVWNAQNVFVMTGRLEAISNWFKIEKFITEPESYKLSYCPSHSMCSDVGITETPPGTLVPRYRLALNNKPYPFRFVKLKVKDA